MKQQKVFVFGSNLAGRHGRGAALDAVKYHGAQVGRGIGYVGNSYAIPTKDFRLKPLPLNIIAMYVRDFLAFADSHPDLKFTVTRVGCGLAGYTDAEIGPMFKYAPVNCELHPKWRDINVKDTV